MTDGLLEVGRITKAHGLRGEVVVQLHSDLDERVAKGAAFLTDAGELVVRSSRVHQDRRLVHFEGIDDRNGAEALRGTALMGEPIEVEGVVFVHELIGAEVRLPDGSVVGSVTAVEDNPASDLLVLSTGHLVPLVFMLDHTPGEVVVIDPPDGLLD
jgi:16S rRNA processing protein RimM